MMANVYYPRRPPPPSTDHQPQTLAFAAQGRGFQNGGMRAQGRGYYGQGAGESSGWGGGATSLTYQVIMRGGEGGGGGSISILIKTPAIFIAREPGTVVDGGGTIKGNAGTEQYKGYVLIVFSVFRID